MKHFRLIFIVAQLFIIGCAFHVPNPADSAHALELVDQAVLSLREQNLDDAEATFELALEFSNLPQVQDGLGCVAMLKGDYSKAENHFLQAISLDENYTEVYGNMALLYELEGKTELARKVFEYAYLRDPENFRVRNNRAAFQFRNGLAAREQVRKELLKAKALVPHPLIEDNVEKLR